MSYILLSHKTHNAVKAYLKKRGHHIIEVPDIPVVYDAVSSHADIFACAVKGKLIASPHIAHILDGASAPYVLSKSIGPKYPENIRYNGCDTGSYFIHNLRFTDAAVLDAVRAASLTEVNVRQGYTKCSVCSAALDALITADEGICRALGGTSCDVLQIRPGHVMLPGVDCGFFGGATGLARGELIINGDLSLHPDCQAIERFLCAHGTRAVSFEGLPITDIGSIIEFN